MTTGPVGEPLRPRRPVRFVVLLLLGLILVVAVWTVVVLLSVRDELTSARTALEQARDGGGIAEARAPLTQAATDLESASDRLHQFGPELASRIPLIGRSVRAVMRTTDAALSVTAATRDVLAVVDQPQPILVDGALDLPRLQQVQQALQGAAQRTQGPVDALSAQPLSLVPETIGSPSRAARDVLVTAPRSFAQSSAALRAALDVLGSNGPRSVLVLLQNNAELRATGGLVSVFAEATSTDGRLQVDNFRDVEDVADFAADVEKVAAPSDFSALFGPFKADTTLWKNANMAPDVPTSSEVIAAVAERTLGKRPDVVLWLDVPAIAALLRATGPVQLPDGRPLSADNAVPLLLSQAYENVPDTLAGQAERRATLRGAADAVLSRLLSSSDAAPSPVSLGTELFDAALGRHLSLWSTDPGVQQDLEAAGIAGSAEAAGGDLTSFAVHNLGGGDADGNKLDFYGRRQVSVDVELDQDSAAVQQEITLRNSAPDRGLPGYVAGRRTPGTSNNFVTVALPDGAQDVSFDRSGRSLTVDPRPLGDHQVVTDVVSLAPGTETTWTLRYRLPIEAGSYRMTLVPQPLAVDAGLSLTVRGPAGVDLRAPDLTRSPDGSLSRSGPFTRALVIDVAQDREGALQRAGSALRRFWSEPVSLG